jgi:hypothetical protein
MIYRRTDRTHSQTLLYFICENQNNAPAVMYLSYINVNTVFVYSTAIHLYLSCEKDLSLWTTAPFSFLDRTLYEWKQKVTQAGFSQWTVCLSRLGEGKWSHNSCTLCGALWMDREVREVRGFRQESSPGPSPSSTSLLCTPQYTSSPRTPPSHPDTERAHDSRSSGRQVSVTSRWRQHREGNRTWPTTSNHITKVDINEQYKKYTCYETKLSPHNWWHNNKATFYFNLKV